MKSVLISGATGLIGKPLSEKLEAKGYEVRKLSRTRKSGHFYWNPSEGKIDENAFENLDAIIHLAGASIANRWTKSYKKELYKSRIDSAELLFETAKKQNANLKTFLTASGINFYGTKTTEIVYKESDPAANDFLGQLCFELEKSANNFESLGARVCAVRTAAVLSTEGGMLKELIPMAEKNLLSVLGSGNQIVPWIHIDDIVNLYIFLLENENLTRPFNAVASEKITNRALTEAMAKALKKKILLPPVPKLVLKIAVGEMSGILLEGSAISNSKIKDAGFDFQFDDLNSALKNLLPTKNR